MLRVGIDPAAALKGAVVRRKSKHARALSRDEVRMFVKGAESCGGYCATVIALRLMLPTLVRTADLRKADCSEIDLERAERMKMGEPHLVMLSRQAVELLKDLQTHTVAIAPALGEVPARGLQANRCGANGAQPGGAFAP